MQRDRIESWQKSLVIYQSYKEQAESSLISNASGICTDRSYEEETDIEMPRTSQAIQIGPPQRDHL